MKQKVLMKILISIFSALVLAGCGKKEVDYSLEEDTEAGTEENEGINDGSLEQFCNQEDWVEDLAVVDTAGNTHTVEIDTKVLLPDLESMRVIKSQPLGKDEEFKKQCLDNFFGTDTEYYYHEPEQYTKSELEKWLPDETELIAKASDSRMVAEEFESVTHYAAYRDEILHEIYLTDTIVTIQPNWEEVSKCGPEEFRGYKQVDANGNPIEGEENGCRYSEEEAEEIADNYMKGVGLSAMECTEKTPIVWRGSNTDYNGEDAMEYICYGYWFEYKNGIDGISFEQFPRPTQYSTSYAIRDLWTFDTMIQGGKEIDFQADNSVGNSTARILVTDEGIYSVTIENAEVIESASNSVGLLPLDTIKKIFRNEIMNRTAKYNIQNYREYNSLQLIYLKVSDEADRSVESIPVWCLSYCHYNSYDHPIFVNAIDGSIVHYADAEWAGVDVTPQ